MSRIDDLSNYGTAKGLIDRLKELYDNIGAVAGDMDFIGDTGAGNIVFNSQNFEIYGTPNQVNTLASGNTLSIALPQDIHSGASPAFSGLTVGSGSGLVLSTAGVFSTVTDNRSNWDAAYTHINSTGVDHTYIDQDVTQTGSPSWSGVNILTGNELRFYNPAGTFYTGFKAPALAGNQIYTLPLADGNPDEALITNGSGVLSWAAVTTSPGGSDTHIQYNNSTAFGGDSGFTYDKAGTVYAATAYNVGASGVYKINGNTVLDVSGTNVLRVGNTGNTTTGSNSVLVGRNILNSQSSTLTYENILVGDNICSGAVSSFYKNVIVGYNIATHADFQGIRNVFVGQNIATNVQGVAIGNVGLGEGCLYSLISGDYNFALGTSALYKITTSSGCVAIGISALQENLANHVIGIGRYAGLYGVNAQDSIFIGAYCGYNTSERRNIIFGTWAARYHYGGQSNFLAGYKVAYGSVLYNFYRNVIIGEEAFYNAATSGDNNVIVGYQANRSNSVADCVVFGCYAGFHNATSNVLIIDNQNRGSAAAEITDCLVRGVFSSTVSNQLLNLNANVTIRHYLRAVPEQITATSSGVAASLACVGTDITTNGDSDLDNVTVADGSDGQLKTFKCIGVGNAADSLKITPTNLVGGTQISFGTNPIGLGCVMEFSSTAGGWVIIGNNGGTIT
jgi:hypothetical protein